MMKLGRHFFTASRKKGGFFTLAKTQDLGEEFVETKVLNKGFLSYSKPSNMEEPQSLQDLDKFPVSYRYFVIDGSHLYSVIHYTGQSNHTPRFGNYFSDTVVLNNADVTDVQNAIPFNIFTSENITWRKRVTIEEEKEIPEHLEQLEVHFEKNHQQLALDKIISQLSEQNFKEHVAILSLLLETILEEAFRKPRKKIIIYGSEPEVRYWIFIATSLFPPQFINVISFTTYFENPTYSPFFINGLIPTGNITPALFEKNDEKYKVVLLDKPSLEDSAYGNEYIQLICDLIEQKDINGISELLNEKDYDLFKVTQLDSSINRAAKFHIILNKITPENNDLKEIFSEFEELQLLLLAEGINISTKKPTLFEKAASINPSALNEFFKSRLQISTIQDALLSITQLYKDYCLYLKSENQEDTIGYNYPDQFLEFALNQAELTETLEFSELCFNLFDELERELDQISLVVLKRMGTAADKLLELELEYDAAQQNIFKDLRRLNSKYSLNLENESKFKLHQIAEDIEEDVASGSSTWAEKISKYFVENRQKISNKIIYLKKLLTSLFKKKLDENDWINLILLTNGELRVIDSDLFSILKSLIIESNFSTQEKKYLFRDMILYCAEFGLESIVKLSFNDDEIIKLITIDDFVSNLKGYAIFNNKFGVKKILSLLGEDKEAGYYSAETDGIDV